MSTPRYLFKEIDREWGDKRIQGGLLSGEGLVYAVRDRRDEKKPIREKGRTVDYEIVMIDEGIQDKRLFVRRRGSRAGPKGDNAGRKHCLDDYSERMGRRAAGAHD